MRVLFQMGLVILNAAMGTLNYSLGNMGVALFNAFAAGFCLAFAIVSAVENK